MELDARVYLAAKMYYIDHMKQGDIAAAMQISNMYVSRLLKKAEQEEIVTFQVRAPNHIDWALGKRLKNKYPYMKEIIAVNIGDGEPRELVGKAAAFYINTLLHSDMTLGLSWGKTIMECVSAMPDTEVTGGKILQMSGGFLWKDNAAMMPSNMVKLLSDRLHCTPVFLNAPLMVENPQVKASLQSDPLLQYVETLSQKMDISLFGISVLGNQSTMSSVGALSAADLQELKTTGAIGDVMGYFIDGSGERVKWAKSECYMGTPFETAISAKHAVCLASGVEKAEVMRLAIEKRYCNTAVISSDIAQTLI